MCIALPSLRKSVNPARAGMIPSGHVTPVTRQSKPRTRGDDPSLDTHVSRAWGKPRTRGDDPAADAALAARDE